MPPKYSLLSKRYPSFFARTPINGNSKTTATFYLQNRYVHTGNLFDELPRRDLYSLNSQLASYSRDGNFLATWDLFSRIHSAFFELDAYTFSPVLRACSALPDTKCGRQVHALMIKTGTDLGTITKTALMDMYSKYGCLGESVKVFEEMEFRDVVTWNALVSSFLRHGLAKEALGIFRAMRRERVEMTEFTLCSVLKACAFIKAFRQGKQVHGLVIVMGRDLVVLGTALIDFYSNVGYIGEAMKVYSCLSCREDEVLRNSLIAGCVKHGRYEEAHLVMSSMRPNAVALTTALSACSDNSDLWVGMQIHCVALRFGFIANTQVCNVWDVVESLRCNMRKKGLAKALGGLASGLSIVLFLCGRFPLKQIHGGDQMHLVNYLTDLDSDASKVKMGRAFNTHYYFHHHHQAMLRALNKHRNPNRYGRLDKEPDTECLMEGELKTSGSSPSHEVSGSPKLCTLGPELAPQNVSPVKPSRRKGSKSHPLFSLCDGAGRKKNTTARPEFARYLQYVKEGGVWV
ncbi:hypothetical protein SADUNF_Sadunf07G0019300 [Salix dunnii]|uniref:Pentatricopeptide repeat-containing protein n=1 Tax=Salix dunnii TaxID=1413687 RepID=A0A835JZH4_9ROSI|nr:hypothetical protein SADUNF_Sadunf07G0019300 [Salix dunnii]